MFLPVVAAALRYGLNGACLALAVAQLAVIVTMQWRNYAPWSLMEFQLLMLVLTMTGLLTGVVVSERFRAEAAFRRSEMRLREKQAQLVHVSRLKLLGEMGSAVAHELNQPITAARAYVRAGERLAASCGAAVQPAIDAMLQAITQLDLAGSILNRIRGMLSQGVRRSEVIELKTAIEEAVALARFEATRARVTIVSRFRRRAGDRDVRSDSGRAGAPESFPQQLRCARDCGRAASYHSRRRGKGGRRQPGGGERARQRAGHSGGHRRQPVQAIQQHKARRARPRADDQPLTGGVRGADGCGSPRPARGNRIPLQLAARCSVESQPT